MSKVIIVTVMLLTAGILTGCHTQGPIEVDAGNLNAVSSPDRTMIVFCRYFRYQYVGYGVTVDPTPYRTAYDACFVYTINRETKEVKKILEHGSQHLSWEGDLIAYNEGPSCETVSVTFDGNLVPPNHIYVMHPDGTNKRLVVQGNVPFMLLPDARKLVYLNGLSLFSINTDGTEKSLIRDLSDLLVNEPPGPGGGYAMTWLPDLVWDPNTNKILIGIKPSSAPYSGVWEMNLDGTDLKRSDHQYDSYFWSVADKIPYQGDRIHSILKELTRDVTYEEWEVPYPEDFD